MPYDEKEFDVVICQECLEHVPNVVTAIKELNRILKNGGYIFITVPYGKNCDCHSHVRQFDISNIYTLLKNDCNILNIIKIPYLNTTYNDNIFVMAEKR